MNAQDRADAVVDVVTDAVGAPWSVVAAAVIDGATTAVCVRPESERDSRCEIGSIGKTMTVTALASLVLDGALRLEDPIGKWLDAGTNGDITVEQLARHTSGLPRLAPNSQPDDPTQPYAHFTAALAEEGLRAATRGPSDRLYSNFGIQVLGIVIERASGLALDELLRTRVWEPLGMQATSVTGAQHPIVQGHNGDDPVPPWIGPLAAPGLMTSTIDDMARYARAVSNADPTSIDEVLALVLERELAWSTQPDGWVAHDGGTAGATALLVARPGHGVAALALVNAGGNSDLADAVFLAATDQDPNGARQRPPSDDEVARLTKVAERFPAGEWAELHAALVGSFRAQVSVEMLKSVWTSATGSLGDLRAVVVTSARAQGDVLRGVVEYQFANGGVRLEIAITANDEIVGLLLR